MFKTIGLLAHVDAGKTTFSEQLFYYGNCIRKIGRVDHKDTFLDNHSVEKERGITVFANQGVFEYEGCKYQIVDTPGHVDFSAETERALTVLDYAIVIISLTDGVQSHTETLWRLLEKNNIPCFLFFNKSDRNGADVLKTENEVSKKLFSNLLDLKKAFCGGKISEYAIEKTAEADEGLLERFFEGETDEFWLLQLKRLIKERKIVPFFFGSALSGEGIEEFLSLFNSLTFAEERVSEAEAFGAKAYKIVNDRDGSRLVFLKITSGQLKVRDEICGEKINQIRIYSGNKFQTSDKAVKGQLCAVTGLSKIKAGMGIGNEKDSFFEAMPMMTAKVISEENIDEMQLLKIFKILEDEEPTLSVAWNEGLREVSVGVMGKIQLEVLSSIVFERFGLKISFGKCRILYKETISKEIMGYGHFEPLRHYAEVHLKMLPLERGSGIRFRSECSNEALELSYQRLVKTHIFEKEHKGILTGSPITDIEFVLTMGRSHLKHTEGGDFREATYRAVRQGLEKAENVLLEPYYKFTAEMESELCGRFMSDIQKMYGEFEPPEMLSDKVRICGRVPVATSMEYQLEFISFTKGKGILSLIPLGYDNCHNAIEVVEQIAYDKDSDKENISSSVFCAKGAGYSVKWDEVHKFIHCK